MATRLRRCLAVWCMSTSACHWRVLPTRSLMSLFGETLPSLQARFSSPCPGKIGFLVAEPSSRGNVLWSSKAYMRARNEFRSSKDKTSQCSCAVLLTAQVVEFNGCELICWDCHHCFSVVFVPFFSVNLSVFLLKIDNFFLEKKLSFGPFHFSHNWCSWFAVNKPNFTRLGSI